jgi:hypothetical protein
MPEYAFDASVKIAVRVRAANEDAARRLLAGCLDCADANFGAWPDGSPITAEASLDGRPALYEVDGVACGLAEDSSPNDWIVWKHDVDGAVMYLAREHDAAGWTRLRLEAGYFVQVDAERIVIYQRAVGNDAYAVRQADLED